MRALKLSSLVERDTVDTGLDGERRRVVCIPLGEDRVPGVRDPDGKHVSPLLRPRLERPEAFEDSLPDSLLQHRDRRRPDERNRVIWVYHVVRKEARPAVVRIVRDREMADWEQSVRRLAEIIRLCKRDAPGLPRICRPVLNLLHGTNRLEPGRVPVMDPQELPLSCKAEEPGHCLHRHPVRGQHICGPPGLPDTVRRIERLLPAASDERSKRLEKERHVVN